MGLVLDFWHLWHSGATPDDVARLDRRLIFGVDFSDSLGPPGSGTSDQSSRRVWPGDGVIPLREWAEAVRSTGFDGWWDNELYSPLHWESADPFGVAAGLLEVLRDTLRDCPRHRAPAMGWSPERIVETADEVWNRLRPHVEYTWPILSLLRGRRSRRCGEMMYGATCIEDLWVPFFCVSSDLTDASMFVHRSGRCSMR